WAIALRPRWVDAAIAPASVAAQIHPRSTSHLESEQGPEPTWPGSDPAPRRGADLVSPDPDPVRMLSIRLLGSQDPLRRCTVLGRSDQWWPLAAPGEPAGASEQQ